MKVLITNGMRNATMFAKDGFFGKTVDENDYVWMADVIRQALIREGIVADIEVQK